MSEEATSGGAPTSQLRGLWACVGAANKNTLQDRQGSSAGGSAWTSVCIDADIN